MNPTVDRPTSVRHLVLSAATLAAVLLYLDRICISFAERFIKEDLALSDKQMGWVLSAFFWSYALAQVPSGWLGDRFGARVMLTVYVLSWSLFTAMTGLTGGLVSLIAVRLGFGMAQAGAYPTSAVLLRRWMPFSSRAWASGIVAFGGRVGGTIAPILTASLIVLLVPVRHSSLLTAHDLLDVRQLCQLIARPEGVPATKLSEAILGRSAPGFAALVEKHDRQYEATLKRDSGRSGTAAALTDDQGTPLESVTRDDQDQLLGVMNQLIAQPDLFEASDFADTPLDPKAKQLLARPRQGLSNAEIERLNRLLLEAVYPAAIRKVYVAGWRSTMLVFGVAGLVVAGLFWWICRDRPELHPGCNRAELQLIGGVPPLKGQGTSRATGLPLRAMLASRSLWLSCLSQFGTNLGWVFLITWLPRYLVEQHHVPVLTRGVMASVPLLVAWLGMLLGGQMTDWLTLRIGVRWGRGLPMSVTRFVAAAAYLVCLLPMGPWSVTCWLAVMAFATDLGVPSVWAFKQDVGGRYVGSILGWGNMWGNLGAAVSPILLESIIARNGNWNAAFLTCSIAFLVSGLAALGVDATIPIEPSDKSRI